jgi:hypothetical protein
MKRLTTLGLRRDFQREAAYVASLAIAGQVKVSNGVEALNFTESARVG